MVEARRIEPSLRASAVTWTDGGARGRIERGETKRAEARRRNSSDRSDVTERVELCRELGLRAWGVTLTESGARGRVERRFECGSCDISGSSRVLAIYPFFFFFFFFTYSSSVGKSEESNPLVREYDVAE